MELVEMREDHIFILRNVSMRDSGNYSCVYSLKKLLPRKITASGQRSIYVQVTDHKQNIFPADIFGITTVKAGENIKLKCGIFDKHVSEKAFHMYLCKNDVGIKMELVEMREYHIFILRNVSMRDSGNYSCVYSLKKLLPRKITASGQRSIYVQVTDHQQDILPADIFGITTVKAGEDLKLKCCIFDKTMSSNVFHVYLCKNGVGVKMEPCGKKENHTFILTNVSVQDSGNYSCVYSLKEFPLNAITASGERSIYVQVTGFHLVKTADIHCDETTVKKGENIEVICSIPEYEESALHVYICKDGFGKNLQSLQNQSHVQFTFENVNLEDSGIYTCVYSAEKYDVSEVNDMKRVNSISIQVYGGSTVANKLD
ncbi:immunoglobulin superfamily member 1-like [Hoplias malabaricus]|uniref:immunoglobulin superfamily member 1-like n=1 Tax=Hoplias malabaricus TaxID=27720 RepID=UPI003461F7C0